jgi:hypothetical protein
MLHPLSKMVIISKNFKNKKRQKWFFGNLLNISMDDFGEFLHKKAKMQRSMIAVGLVVALPVIFVSNNNLLSRKRF